jgi:hypothetical protein
MKRKKRGKRKVRKKSYKKKVDMKSPLIIILVVLVLFSFLIIFSVLKGPVEKEEVVNEGISEQSIVDRAKEIMKKNTDENPSIKINKAVASGDISNCNNDRSCEISFIFSTAREPGDCNKMPSENLKNNCKDIVWTSKVIETNDKSLCDNILDMKMKNMCGEL